MRPLVDDRAVTILRSALPEFEPHFLDLVDLYDEDLTAQVVFNELADLVTELLRERTRPVLVARCFHAIEAVIVTPGDEPRQLVEVCFLDQLPPFALAEAKQVCGPRTALAIERLEAGDDPFDPGEAATDPGDDEATDPGAT